MEEEQWLIGWREIGKYLGRSAKTAQRWAKDGMPFFRDPAGRPMAMKSHLDDYIIELNQCHYDDKKWKDKGIKLALDYEDYKERQRKDFDQKFLEAQKPPRSRY